MNHEQPIWRTAFLPLSPSNSNLGWIIIRPGDREIFHGFPQRIFKPVSLISHPNDTRLLVEKVEYSGIEEPSIEWYVAPGYLPISSLNAKHENLKTLRISERISITIYNAGDQDIQFACYLTGMSVL